MVSATMQDNSTEQQGETVIWLTEAGPGIAGKLPANSVTTLGK